MASVTITIKDTEDGEMDVHVVFSEPGMDHNSRAHLLALTFIQSTDMPERPATEGPSHG